MLAALASLAGNVAGGIMADRAKSKDIKLQKEFAQSGIQWKVEDAKKAGIHPLAALGAQTTSYAPVSVGGGLPSALAAGGQDISRAINATRPESARLDAYSKTVQDLNLQRLGLENQLLSSQIAKINQAGTPPAMPTAGDRFLIDGQGNSPLIKSTPLERVGPAAGQPSTEPGAVVDMGFARTAGGGWAPTFSKDFQERTEEDMLGSIAWAMRNRLAPSLNPKYYNPPQVPLADGEMWSFNPVNQEYRIVRGRPTRYDTRAQYPWNRR